jgi:hypothetical protein
MTPNKTCHLESLTVQMKTKSLKRRMVGIRVLMEMKTCASWPLELGCRELGVSSRCWESLELCELAGVEHHLD